MEKYYLIDSDSINQVRKEIESAKSEKIIMIAKGDEFNRKIFENKKVDIVSGLELGGKDRLKQRDSGLNQVLCKLAKQNNIEIGIDFSFISKLDDFKVSRYLSRLQQNIKLCKKYKVYMVLINSFGNRQDLMAFLLSLGMSTSMAKYAVDNTITFNNK